MKKVINQPKVTKAGLKVTVHTKCNFCKYFQDSECKYSEFTRSSGVNWQDKPNACKEALTTLTNILGI